ncbi:MAG: hypothetical protein HKN05_07760 [Rhizobiales bacterium]|nr:hypothetical protein [Hyphomicrobiales bacterium]
MGLFSTGVPSQSLGAVSDVVRQFLRRQVFLAVGHVEVDRKIRKIGEAGSSIRVSGSARVMAK